METLWKGDWPWGSRGRCRRSSPPSACCLWCSSPDLWWNRRRRTPSPAAGQSRRYWEDWTFTHTQLERPSAEGAARSILPSINYYHVHFVVWLPSTNKTNTETTVSLYKLVLCPHISIFLPSFVQIWMEMSEILVAAYHRKSIRLMRKFTSYMFTLCRDWDGRQEAMGLMGNLVLMWRNMGINKTVDVGLKQRTFNSWCTWTTKQYVSPLM